MSNSKSIRQKAKHFRRGQMTHLFWLWATQKLWKKNIQICNIIFAVFHKHEWKCFMVWWNCALMFLAVIPKTCFAQKPHCTSADERPSSQTIFCFCSTGTRTLVVLLLIKLIIAYWSRVDHVIGIRGTSLDCYSLYLSEKYQFACVHYFSSLLSRDSHGVPQCSVLGTISLTLYMPQVDSFSLLWCSTILIHETRGNRVASKSLYVLRTQSFLQKFPS